MTNGQSEGRKSRRNAAPYIILVFEVIVSVVVILCLKDNPAKWVSGIVLLAICILFVVFLFSMAAEAKFRNPTAVIFYVLINIAAIICLFGNIYRWIGLKDSLGGCVDLGKAIYFSAVTWTTLGYGDIAPIQADRWIAAIEALLGYVVMSLLIAVLLAMVRR